MIERCCSCAPLAQTTGRGHGSRGLPTAHQGSQTPGLRLALGLGLAFLLAPMTVRAADDFACFTAFKSAGALGSATDKYGECAARGGECSSTGMGDGLCVDPSTQATIFKRDPITDPSKLKPPPSAPAASGSGSGKKTAANSTPSGTEHFDLASFEPGTLTYAKTLYTGGNLLRLDVLGFSSDIAYVATDDPSIFTGSFTNFEWLYRPFALPGDSHGLIDREVLDTAALSDFANLVFDVSAGDLYANVPLMLLSVSGEVVSRHTSFLTLHFSADADPALVNVRISEEARLQVIPLPGTLWLVLLAVSAAAAARRQRVGIAGK